MMDMECHLKTSEINGWLLELQANAFAHIHQNHLIENVLEKKGLDDLPLTNLEIRFLLSQKKKGTSKWLKVDIDWTSYYADSEKKADIRLFTDVENTYTYTDAEDSDTSGTKLIITCIREPWTKKEIEHLTREISKIVSPFANLSYPFKVHVIASEFNIDKESVRTLDDFTNATLSISIDFDKEKNLQQSIFYDKGKKLLVTTLFHSNPLEE